MMTIICSNCSTELPTVSLFCSKCGTATLVPTPPPPTALPYSSMYPPYPPSFSPHQHLEGLGGWLICYGFGLVISPILIVRTIFSSNLSFLVGPKHQAFLSNHPEFTTFIAYEIITNIVFLLALIFLIYLFFSKKRLFPLLMIIYLILHACILIFNHFVFQMVAPSADFVVSSVRLLAHTFLNCLVWIPYLLISRRVKVTFVR